MINCREIHPEATKHSSKVDLTIYYDTVEVFVLNEVILDQICLELGKFSGVNTKEDGFDTK